MTHLGRVSTTVAVEVRMGRLVVLESIDGAPASIAWTVNTLGEAVTGAEVVYVQWTSKSSVGG
jgi:hypothetical protein